jgi:hypothetical protein
MDYEINAKPDPSERSAAGAAVRHRVRLPQFIVTEPVGLGQIVKRATSAVGVRPCAPCEQREARLDHWLQIEPRR